MKLRKRDVRAVAALGLALAIFLVLRFALPGNGQPAVVGIPGGLPPAERRLARLRQLMASVPAKEHVLKSVSADLEEREKAIIQAETGAQAQAQVLQIVRRVAKAQATPLEIRSVELGQLRAFGEDYGEALVSVTVECQIEDLLNLLADLTAQPEMVALNDMRIGAANAKEKTVSARLTVSGVVPRRLVPEKKGLARF